MVDRGKVVDRALKIRDPGYNALRGFPVGGHLVVLLMEPLMVFREVDSLVDILEAFRWRW